MVVKTFFLCIALLVCSGTFAQAVGKVVGVQDGDTFTLLLEGNIQVRIRLHGIDAPESGQDFGQVSKKFLSDKIFGKVVWVKTSGNDRYGRTIGIIYTDSTMTGLSVNEQSLEAGLSWHYKQYDSNPRWAELESIARERKNGLWLYDNPTPPWQYRRAKKASNFKG